MSKKLSNYNANAESLVNYLVRDSRIYDEEEFIQEEYISCTAESEELETVDDEESHNLTKAKELSGLWRTHRFDNQPWSDNDKPFIKIEEYENLKLDEDEQLGILSDRIIATGLSYIDKSPEILQYTLCKCVLFKKNLEDISAIRFYHYLQYLDISQNQLTSLSPLSQLPFLQYLDASHNCLEILLDFKAPLFLSFANFSHNFIRSIPDLDNFWSITHLDISYNRITDITGILNLRFLSYLDLSYNEIVILTNLQNMRIQFLYLHHNIIESFDEYGLLYSLTYLRMVDLSHNKLNSLRPFQHTKNLESINMSDNNICSLLELYYLENLRYLSRLCLSNNYISSSNHYKSLCIKIVNNLMTLDGNDITAEQRIKVKNPNNINMSMQARKTHMELLLLQQINNPDIGPYIMPYDQSPPKVFVLVGPPGSRKKETLKMLCKSFKKLSAGVSHTTRPKTDKEVHGEDYYFISNDEFNHLIRRGKFLTLSEFNGHLYGIMQEELQKTLDKILIFQADINCAFSLKILGFNTYLILTVPKNEDTHLKWLKMKYISDQIEQDKNVIRYCPERAVNENFDKYEVSQESMKKEYKKISTRLVEKIIESALLIVNNRELAGENNRNAESSGNKTEGKRDLPGPTEYHLFKHKFMEKSSENQLADKFLEEKSLDQIKKVSFYNFSDLQIVADDSILSMAERSVSATMELAASFCSIDSNPNDCSQSIILSVVSTEDLNKPVEEDRFKVESEESEESEEQKADPLILFFKKIIDSRLELLQLHWSNPGLFREIIFTDEKRESLQKFKELLKFSLENYIQQDSVFTFEDDLAYNSILNGRISELNLYRDTRRKLHFVEGQCLCNMKNKHVPGCF